MAGGGEGMGIQRRPVGCYGSVSTPPIIVMMMPPAVRCLPPYDEEEEGARRRRRRRQRQQRRPLRTGRANRASVGFLQPPLSWTRGLLTRRTGGPATGSLLLAPAQQRAAASGRRRRTADTRSGR
ncbi:hypothetical protein I4F81_003409 [Pyropia yezoensis]|uniref:Uncharacterized protein n=1 Tax=Pyropia yezoensis TaxID=2788 RepID=A0ACC3BTE2_PYRYE|nr:hypothetical protein I4F81_003409 [Neopyropia yezoensis]